MEKAIREMSGPEKMQLARKRLVKLVERCAPRTGFIYCSVDYDGDFLRIKFRPHGGQSVVTHCLPGYVMAEPEESLLEWLIGLIDDSQTHKDSCLDEISRLEDELNRKIELFLRGYGWQYVTCEADSLARWQKEIDGFTYRVDVEDALRIETGLP